METPSVGFLDLPREVRDMIYSLLLCNFQIRESRYDTYLSGDVHPAILRANRKICDEAREVFYKTNRFVRVNINLELPAFTRLEDELLSSYLPLPISQDTTSSINAFKGPVLTYNLSETKDLEKENVRLSFIMLHSHFEWFCRRVDNFNLISDFGEDTTHSIILHNPLEGMNESYPNIDQQKAFLAPFARLCGVENFLIQGTVDAALATQVMSQVQSIPYDLGAAILEDLHRQSQLGYEYLRQNNLEKSSEAWAGACLRLECLAVRNDTHCYYIPDQLLEQFAKLFFELTLNRSINNVRAIEANLDDTELVSSLTESVLSDLFLGQHIGINSKIGIYKKYFLSTRWEPSTWQRAEALRQESKVYRLTQVYKSALEAIEGAESLCPDDPGIREEKLAVEEMPH